MPGRRRGVTSTYNVRSQHFKHTCIAAAEVCRAKLDSTFSGLSSYPGMSKASQVSASMGHDQTPQRLTDPSSSLVTSPLRLGHARVLMKESMGIMGELNFTDGARGLGMAEYRIISEIRPYLPYMRTILVLQQYFWGIVSMCSYPASYLV